MDSEDDCDAMPSFPFIYRAIQTESLYCHVRLRGRFGCLRHPVPLPNYDSSVPCLGFVWTEAHQWLMRSKIIPNLFHLPLSLEMSQITSASFNENLSFK